MNTGSLCQADSLPVCADHGRACMQAGLSFHPEPVGWKPRNTWRGKDSLQVSRNGSESILR